MDILIEFLINFLKIKLQMKRPQSAKPGHKGNWAQTSLQDPNDHQQRQNRRQVKLLKPDLTTHDFARILPRKIQQDKQRLYSQALTLKHNMNEITQENIRLKTKISVLQKEKDKMNKFIETAPEGLGKGSRLNMYQNRGNQKDNMMIRNLKKMVRQTREDNDDLRMENQKIKKMMKYTKINELQIETKMTIDQNKRISTMLEEYATQLRDQQELQKQNQQLRKYIEEEFEDKNQLEEQKQEYEKIIESLQEKIKNEADKFQNREKKLIRDINVEKRKVQDLQRKNEQLSREFKSMRENQQFIQKQKNMLKAAPVIRVNRQKNNHTRVHTQQYESTSQVDKKMNEMRLQNQRLQKQLQQIKQKLKKAQSEITMFDDKSSVNIKLQPSQMSEDPFTQKINLEVKSSLKKEQNHEDEYDERFQQEETRIKESQNEEQIQKYKKDFEENEQAQQLYKKQEKPKKPKNKVQKSEKKKQKKSLSKEQAYKPNKKMLAEIKQLLTYRMKSQRYPFSDIKSDIESAQTNVFTYADLCNMLVNQPFYLTPDYTQIFLRYCFQKEKIEGKEAISNGVFVGKLRKVIDNFELMQENEEKDMIIRIAQMTSTYPRQLQVAFENIKNGEQTVARKDLIDMFKKLELEDKYIDLIIAELSLCSDDLEHLNFHGFFERFYIEEEEDYIDNAIVEQGEESEESRNHSSRVRKHPKNNSSSLEEEVERTS